MVDQVAMVEAAATKTMADLVGQEAVVEQGQAESSGRDNATSGRAVVVAVTLGGAVEVGCQPSREKCMRPTHQMVIPFTGSADSSGKDSGSTGLGALPCGPWSA
ncbi:hypothetical protein ABG768_025723 [Culter alburnus]|uniref:Uncharacterized protein n=1 Tax=Culter alburnus TaxID=194366 RepID=A0AAW2AI20_CULAL